MHDGKFNKRYNVFTNHNNNPQKYLKFSDLTTAYTFDSTLMNPAPK